jgi:hypothetical protein
MPHRRVTLIARAAATPDRDWDLSPGATAQICIVDGANALTVLLRPLVTELNLDVERVVIDGGGSATELLGLLAALPRECGADVLWIGNDGGGFLSACGRGGDRVIYALSVDDIRFYLEINGLVTGRVALPALQEA